MAKRLAEGVRDVLTRESSLCNVSHNDNYPVLLILDRRADPVTPLLNQVHFTSILYYLYQYITNISFWHALFSKIKLMFSLIVDLPSYGA